MNDITFQLAAAAFAGRRRCRLSKWRFRSEICLVSSVVVTGIYLIFTAFFRVTFFVLTSLASVIKLIRS